MKICRKVVSTSQEHHDHAARVDELERLGQQVPVHDAVGQAVEHGVEDAGLTVAAQPLGAFGGQRPLIRREVGEDVAEVLRVERFTDPEQPAGARGSPGTCQMPERSGLPLSRGTGPVMLILPSRVRGAPAMGVCSHCASTVRPAATHAAATIAVRQVR